jgi:hypothetical protein
MEQITEVILQCGNNPQLVEKLYNLNNDSMEWHRQWKKEEDY